MKSSLNSTCSLCEFVHSLGIVCRLTRRYGDFITCVSVTPTTTYKVTWLSISFRILCQIKYRLLIWCVLSSESFITIQPAFTGIQGQTWHTQMVSCQDYIFAYMSRFYWHKSWFIWYTNTGVFIMILDDKYCKMFRYHATVYITMVV